MRSYQDLLRENGALWRLVRVVMGYIEGGYTLKDVVESLNTVFEILNHPQQQGDQHKNHHHQPRQ